MRGWASGGCGDVWLGGAGLEVSVRSVPSLSVVASLIEDLGQMFEFLFVCLLERQSLRPGRINVGEGMQILLNVMAEIRHWAYLCAAL
eukprot:3355424-Rhodomonas_salina.3